MAMARAIRRVEARREALRAKGSGARRIRASMRKGRPTARAGPAGDSERGQARKWTPQGRPVVRQDKQSMKYFDALKAIRSGEVKDLVFVKEGAERAMLIFRDGEVRYTQFAPDDKLLMDALQAGNVQAKQAQAEPTPAKGALDDIFGAVAMYWLPTTILAGVYGVTVLMAKRKGDWEDRQKLRRMEQEQRKERQRKEASFELEEAGEDAFRGVGEKEAANRRASFQDVAGIGEARLELEEIVEFFRQPERFRASGSRVPKGVLLSGSPGTGKTLLARAVAGEANVPFFSITASEFVEMFVGVGAARVRDLFQKAKARAPAIVFIDELDAVGRTRGGGGGGNEERDQTLNQLLSELDGFDTDLGVVVMASTNRPDVLDGALVRPGRFDRRIWVDEPDFSARLEILQVHAGRKPMDESVDLADIAFRAPGFSGAGLANLVNVAALVAAKDSRERVSQSDLDAALEMETLGKLTGEEEEQSPEFRRRLALHRAASAVAARSMPRLSGLELVTVLPREALPLGQVRLRFDEDKERAGVETREHLLQRAAVHLAGRCQEELEGSEPSSLSEEGFSMARALLAHAASSGGMFPSVTGRRALAYPVSEETHVVPPGVSEADLASSNRALLSALESADAMAREVLSPRQSAVRAVADSLLEKGTLTSSEVGDILASHSS